MRTARVLLCSWLLGVPACDKPGGAATDDPDGQRAALPPKEEGERLEKVRAALQYRRAAEQRGQLAWREGDGGRRLALERMYLQGTEDLGELSLVREGPRRIAASISILARGSGGDAKCKATLTVGGAGLAIRSQLQRGAEPPEGLRVEVDRLSFDLDLAQLQRLAATPDSGGSACGLAFAFTRAQRDRLDRVATLFAGNPDDAAVADARAQWDSDRPPSEDGGFRPLE
jgi:hypothetical protein